MFVVYVPASPGYSPDQRITNLTYELASYPQGADLRGPGNLLRSGPLSSLNTTGSLEFHDVEAVGWFTPNDFFILVIRPLTWFSSGFCTAPPPSPSTRFFIAYDRGL